jgi:hypothetical protein
MLGPIIPAENPSRVAGDDGAAVSFRQFDNIIKVVHNRSRKRMLRILPRTASLPQDNQIDGGEGLRARLRKDD